MINEIKELSAECGIGMGGNWAEKMSDAELEGHLRELKKRRILPGRPELRLRIFD